MGWTKRVVVVRYSYGLAICSQRSLLVGSASRWRAFVATFEDRGRRWGVTDFGLRDDSDFWEVDLPRRMAGVASALTHTEQFDANIVHEAQDLAVDRRYLLRPRHHGLQGHGAVVAVHGWAGAWSVARRRWAYARQPSSSMSSRTARAPALSLHSGSMARRELRASARTRSASVASCW